MQLKKNFSTYREGSIIEAIIFVAFEKVRIAIHILEGCIQVVRQSFPIGYGFWITGLDRWPLQWIETPEFAAFEEVNLAVSAPDHCRIQMVWYTSKTFADLFRIVAVHLTSIEPPVLSAFEEVGFSVLVGKGSINIA